ncbi:MAG: metallophosphoesterase [Planctomycetia bacterium]|nr:metallophosphoesterase [Planctomycetia bacterium]
MQRSRVARNCCSRFGGWLECVAACRSPSPRLVFLRFRMSEISRRTLLERGAALALSASLATPWQVEGAEPTTAAKPDTAKPETAAKPVAPKVDPYLDAVFVEGAPPQPAADSFTVVVLPDTQHYSEKFPEQYYAQTEWIAANAKERRIAAVFHLGDITNKSTPTEWKVAQQAMRKLDGIVPYFLTLGNHDYSEMGACADRTTLYNEYFPASLFRATKNFGGSYDREPERMENSYQLFSAGGRDFLVLSLEFGPRNDVVRWANEVAAANKDKSIVLLTHAYMYYDETRYDWAKCGKDQKWNPHDYKVAAATADDVNDGEQLWQKLVSKHENFVLTLNGHVLNDGLARIVSKTPGGREVPQVLVNFQMKPHGGDGWLRLLEFKADGKTVDVRDYSPTLNRQNESKQNRFLMELASPLV